MLVLVTVLACSVEAQGPPPRLQAASLIGPRRARLADFKPWQIDRERRLIYLLPGDDPGRPAPLCYRYAVRTTSSLLSSPG